jgi:oligopeptide/dipeptide ABC transporter ATP-binding protein
VNAVHSSTVFAVPLLEVDGLRTQFFTRDGRVHAVDGVSFTLEQGRVLGVVGESGCGKSVMALSLLGLLPPRQAAIVAGHVRYDGRELTTLGRRQLEDVRGREIAMVFQDPMTSLNPTLSIGDQLMEPLRRHLDLSRRAARRRAIELLQEVEIPGAATRLDDYPHNYSGGMRQRVMIAIAVACRPKLLIADEPTTALDVTVQASVLDLLHDLQQEYEMALLLITHDMGVIAEMADDVLVMYAGQVVEHAPALELFDHPEHPYTEALLAALPKVDVVGAQKQHLAAIPGRPPSLLHPPAVCRFAARCPYAKQDDPCMSQMPELRELRPSHFVRTFHPASERVAAAGVSA